MERELFVLTQKPEGDYKGALYQVHKTTINTEKGRNPKVAYHDGEKVSGFELYVEGNIPKDLAREFRSRLSRDLGIRLTPKEDSEIDLTRKKLSMIFDEELTYAREKLGELIPMDEENGKQFCKEVHRVGKQRKKSMKEFYKEFSKV